MAVHIVSDWAYDWVLGTGTNSRARFDIWHFWKVPGAAL